jgi:hypothetical protein
MFRPPPRALSGARRAAFERVGRRQPPRRFGRCAVEAFWLALLAAAFALWAVSPNAGRSDGETGVSPGCAFAGKAGIVCDASAASPRREPAPDRSAAPCVSFGKGGRLCPPTATP